MHPNFTPPAEWERRVDNLCTGQRNHDLRQALALLRGYWELAEMDGWTEVISACYVKSQAKINALLGSVIKY